MPDSMAESTIYTRVYCASAHSPAPLASEMGSEGGPMTEEELLTEFEIHANTEVPTSLVTVSKRIMDTLDAALQWWQGGNESPDEIWIAFVEVPADDPHETPIRVHAAEELAARCGLPDPRRFRDEAVVEWAVQEKYISHRVSLQTLLDRQLLQFVDEALLPWFASGGTVWERMACWVQSVGEPGDAGEIVGLFATHFGARAPLGWVANQVFDDCAGFTGGDEGYYETDDELDSNPFGWSATEFGTMDVYIREEFSEWLESSEFIYAHANFKEWGAMVHDVMFYLEIEFWEGWHSGDAAFIDTLSEEDRIAFTTEYRWLLDDIEFLLELIEEKAVKIGL